MPPPVVQALANVGWIGRADVRLPRSCRLLLT